MLQFGHLGLIRQDWHVSRKLSPTLFLASIARRNRCLAARTKETFRSYPFQDDERETLVKAREHALPENFIHRVSAVSPTLFAATRDRKLLFPLCDSGCEKIGPTRLASFHVMRQHCGQAFDRGLPIEERRIAARLLTLSTSLRPLYWSSINSSLRRTFRLSWYRFCCLVQKRFPTVQFLADKRRRAFLRPLRPKPILKPKEFE